MLYEPVIAEVVRENLWPKGTLVRWPIKSMIDFAVIENGKIFVLLEVKRRLITSSQYENAIFPATKTAAAIAASSYLKVPIRAAVLYIDTLLVFDLTKPIRQVMIKASGRGSTAIAHYEYAIASAARFDDLAAQINERVRRNETSRCLTTTT